MCGFQYITDADIIRALPCTKGIWNLMSRVTVRKVVDYMVHSVVLQPINAFSTVMK